MSFSDIPEDVEVQVQDNGFTRVKTKGASHLICPELNRRVSLICAEGLVRYPHKDSPGLTTAVNDSPLYDLVKHMKDHLDYWLSGCVDEDHLAKVAWSIQQIMHQECEGSCQHYSILVGNAKARKTT